MSRQPLSPLDVVVVIPSFNQVRLLAECIDSVQAAIAHAGLAGQVVVVDNASWDGSAAMVAERYPQVTLLENDVNMGFAAACNLGGKVYQSRYVLLMNNDATVTPDSLRAVIDFADSKPTLGALTGRLMSPEGRERYPASHFWQRWFPPPPHVHELSWVPGTCLLLRRQALDEVGWLDEDFFFYNEDLDLSLRLKKAAWQLYYHPSLVVQHRESGSSQLIRPRAMLEGYRGSLLLARKHYGPWAYRLTRFGLMVDVMARLLVLRVREALHPRDLNVRGRREAYEAIREVLARGVQSSEPDEIRANQD